MARNYQETGAQSQVAGLRPREIQPIFGEDSGMAEQYHRMRRAESWSLRDPDTFAEKSQQTWNSLATQLTADSSSQLRCESDQKKLLLLADLANGCQSFYASLRKLCKDRDYKNIPEDQRKYLDRLVEPRDNQVVKSDTVEAHAARSAGNVYDMGIVDPYAFLVAGLHDIGEILNLDPVRNIGQGERPLQTKIINKLNSAFKKYRGEINVDTLVGHLGAFERERVEKQKALEAQISRMRSGDFDTYEPEDDDISKLTHFEFGTEASWEGFVEMQYWVDIHGTNRPTPVGDGTFHYESILPNKFPNIVQVLRDANSTITPESAKRKGQFIPKSASNVIAELAIALDHSYFPKTGSANENSLRQQQKIALGILRTVQPRLQAFEDPYRRLGLEIIYRAFMPEAFDNLYSAVQSLDNEHGGYIDHYDEEYSKYVRTVVDGLRERHPQLVFVSDETLQQRKMKVIFDADGKNNLLLANEIHVPGLGNDAEGKVRLSRKTAASIITKVIDYLHLKPRSLEPTIHSMKFGSLEFWKYVIPRMHDLIRTQFTFGDSVAEDAIKYIFDIFNEMDYSSDFDPNSRSDVGHSHNYAQSLHWFESDSDAKSEFVQYVAGCMNIICAQRASDASDKRPGLNFEFHGIPQRQDIERRFKPTPAHWISYKSRVRVENQAPTEEVPFRATDEELQGINNRNKEKVAKMREDLAKEGVAAHRSFLQFAYGIEMSPSNDTTVSVMRGSLYSGRNRKQRRKSGYPSQNRLKS